MFNLRWFEVFSCHFLELQAIWGLLRNRYISKLLNHVQALRFPSEMFAIFISTGENDSATVSHMLKFISGLEQVPPLGLPNKITVKLKYFCSANCPCWPTASTCGPSITFPLHYDTYDPFCESMSSALIESCGFGFF